MGELNPRRTHPLPFERVAPGFPDRRTAGLKSGSGRELPVSARLKKG
jgi:hypothetical protein